VEFPVHNVNVLWVSANAKRHRGLSKAPTLNGTATARPTLPLERTEYLNQQLSCARANAQWI